MTGDLGWCSDRRHQRELGEGGGQVIADGGLTAPSPQRAPGRVPERGEVAQNRSWPGLISPSRSAHEAGAVAAAYLDSQDTE